MAELIFKDEVYAIIGAALEVYNTLRPGFAEGIYQESLEIESALRKLPYTPQSEIPVYYKNLRLKKSYLADFVYFEKIIVEIKALDKLTSREDAQLLNYLKATRYPLGLLINFGSPGELEWKRLVGNEATIYRINQARRYVRED
jgi:GxxExxY protein